MINHPAIDTAISYLKNRGVSIPSNLLRVLPETTTEEKAMIAKSIIAKEIPSRAIKQATFYQPVRDELWSLVYDAVYVYLNSPSPITNFASTMAVAVSKAYIETLDLAYVDGGGSLPVDEDTVSWAKSELDAQLSYVDSLFSTLREMRKEGGFDSISEAFSRADKWSSALDGFYNSIKMMGAGNIMLTWAIGSTEKHCDTCLSLDGQRHRASWFVSRGYSPRKPGSNTDCGGYHCDCSLVTDEGMDFTI